MNPCVHPATNTTLSDAMERAWNSGLRQRKQGYQTWSKTYSPQTRHLEVKLTEACAIGAACYEVAPTCEIDRREQAVRLFPQLQNYVPQADFPYPVRDIKVVSLGDLLTYYNDRTNLSPAEIVDAVRKLGY
jgi:hypothetical protein